MRVCGVEQQRQSSFATIIKYGRSAIGNIGIFTLWRTQSVRKLGVSFSEKLKSIYCCWIFCMCCNVHSRIGNTYSLDGICMVSTIMDFTYRWSLHQNRHSDRGSSTFISCAQFSSTFRMLSPKSCGFVMTIWYFEPCSSRAVPLVRSMLRNAPRSENIEAVR